MGWARFDDGYMMHPKVLEAVALAGPYAELLDRRAIEWSAKNETDGLITRASLRMIGAGIPRLASRVDALLQVGRWTVNEGGGYWVHDFLEYNPSKAEKQRQREQGRERVRKHRSNGVTSAYQSRGGEGNTTEKQRVREIKRCARCGHLDLDCECGPELSIVGGAS